MDKIESKSTSVIQAHPGWRVGLVIEDFTAEESLRHADDIIAWSITTTIYENKDPFFLVYPITPDGECTSMVNPAAVIAPSGATYSVNNSFEKFCTFAEWHEAHKHALKSVS